MRRSKQAMACMRTLVEIYLNDNGNDPQKAYNEYIGWHLMNNVKLPLHVDGIRDFIKVSKENARRYEHNIKLEENAKREKEEKESVKDKVKAITLEQAKQAYNKVKSTGTKQQQMTIVDLYMQIANGYEYKYNTTDIHVLRELKLI